MMFRYAALYQTVVKSKYCPVCQISTSCTLMTIQAPKLRTHFLLIFFVLFVLIEQNKMLGNLKLGMQDGMQYGFH